MHYRAAMGNVRCPHRHRSEHAARVCGVAMLGVRSGVVLCIGGGAGTCGELERWVRPVLKVVQP